MIGMSKFSFAFTIEKMWTGFASTLAYVDIVGRKKGLFTTFLDLVTYILPM